MRIDEFSSGRITIDDVADDHDVVVHHGAIKTQTKQPSRQCSGRR
jgi:hypothetical protein